MSEPLDHRKLYRLPWSLSDNTIAWLEPTSKCNIYCEGCYRANVNQHKSMEEISADLDVFAKYRTFDGVSIAGGDPLTHPKIVDIVKMIQDRGWKPILNTNGHALKPELLRELKRAGLMGITLHVDSKQMRPGWKGKTELELNELRLQLAKMIGDAGDISCAFNSTVYSDTLDQIPGMVDWAQEHIDLVHVMVFICFRAAVESAYEYYAGARKIDMQQLVYSDPPAGTRLDITARDVVAKIRERHPDFEPCAYLNGTEKPDSFKWLLTGRFGTKKKIYGYMGPKFIELAQTSHHLRTGRYLAYAEPKTLRRGKWMLWLWPFDKGLRRTFLRAFFDPRLAFRPLHLQSIMIIQPIDVTPDGRQNMCDGCPDMTVWDGRLAWSCRLEECMKFGQFVRTVPKACVPAPEGEPVKAGTNGGA
ncbi:MAG: radical SAM protein [Planctomycetes bacterium]|nr:radical SAM protein [Planctomycetota bacterium]